MGKYGISESDSFFACLLLVKDNVKPGVSDGRQDMLRGIQFPLTLSGSSYKDDTCYIAKEKMSRKQYLSVGQLRGWCCRIQKVPKSCKLKAATYFSKHSQVCCTLRQTNENPPKINAKKKEAIYAPFLPPFWFSDYEGLWPYVSWGCLFVSCWLWTTSIAFYTEVRLSFCSRPVTQSPGKPSSFSGF